MSRWLLFCAVTGAFILATVLLVLQMCGAPVLVSTWNLAGACMALFFLTIVVSVGISGGHQ